MKSMDNHYLSPNFTLMELTVTQLKEFDNTPNELQIRNLKRLCDTVLEPLRVHFGPYYISSGFRSKPVNTVIGGAWNSRHMDGCAADGAPISKVPWKDVIQYALTHLPVDQVIYEYGRWLHMGIALEGAEPRRQSLMIFSNGKYEQWNPNDRRVTR